MADVINLFSDTQTRPTEGMRKAMYEAEVGDEQRLADPTTNALQERVAELLGHQAGLFLPTGTMCNEIAYRLHLGPGGDEVILDKTAHPLPFEAGGPASLSGAGVSPLDEAWRYKQMWGGAMRQSGVVAAAGLYALDHHVERLAEDHENARLLAEGLAEIDGVTIDPSKVDTNIVVFEVADATKTGDELRSAGVQVTRLDATRLRAVTHLDVDRGRIDRALEVMRSIITTA